MEHDRHSMVAMLGPTNTGKTHQAVERMLEHASGIIGLPLRLLAREIYDRVTARVGERAVALVTGEEKRIPTSPRYWVCTVESMPVERAVDFVAVDEVQLAAHAQRGHVFTERLLGARGAIETWFLGAETMRPMIEELVPTAVVRRQPRLSKLSLVGASGLSALPPRSAVIAFSAAEVYQLAEKLKRRRGGAAVVLGALSPRTRNAQVAMYQAGEVDFMVATDAVGMGLNMDVDHVAFAALHKYDGARTRALAPDEMAQIAGRAGRYTRDGSFGALSPLELPDEAAFAIEQHRFAYIRRVMWRNADLDTSSVAALALSLSQRPKNKSLVPVDEAADVAALNLLAERPSVTRVARDPDAVALLWDVCRVPDYPKLLMEHHANLLEGIFVQLIAPAGKLDTDFMHQRISRLEDDRGDIDTLLMRMESVRTWSYIAHQSRWVHDAPSWQARTTMAEDRLSQALHERLVERFVDGRGRYKRRSATKARGRAIGPRPEAQNAEPGSGPFASLLALRELLAAPAAGVPASAEWVEAVVAADHRRFVAGLDGAILYVPRSGVDGAAPAARASSSVVGRLTRGGDRLHPEVKLALDREVGAGARARILRRVRAWARDLVDETLGRLRDPRISELGAAGRGLVYQLETSLGTIDVRRARAQLAELDEREHALLAELGVVIGRRLVYLPALLERDSLERRLLLCAVHHAGRMRLSLGDGAPATLEASGADHEIFLAIGYPVVGPRAIRADLLERLDERLNELADNGPFQIPEATAAWLGMDPDELAPVVTALGYRKRVDGFVRAPRRSRARRSRHRR